MCVSNITEFFQEQPNKTEKTIDGSVHGLTGISACSASSGTLLFVLMFLGDTGISRRIL